MAINWKGAIFFIILMAVMIYVGEWVLGLVGLTGPGMIYETLYIAFPLFLGYLLLTKTKIGAKTLKK